MSKANKGGAEPGERPVGPQSKRYEEGFKRQAVESWPRSGKSGSQIARELGVSYPCLKEWKRRYHGEVAPAPAELEEVNRALKAELARVREQRDILIKLWASSPNHRCALRTDRSHEE